MKKLLIIGAEVQPIPPIMGGAVECLVASLLKSEQIRADYEITVVSPAFPGVEEAAKEYPNIHFKFIKIGTMLDRMIDFADLFLRRFFDKTSGIAYIHKVCNLLKKEQYDLVIIENRPYFGKFLKNVCSSPVLLHLHNDFINRDTRHLHEILPYYSGMIVVSDYLRKRCSEVYSGLIEVVYNGIDLASFLPGNQEVSGTIVYAGRIVKEKGVLELVRAFSRLKGADIRLMIIGGYDPNDVDNKDFIQEYERLLTLDKRIETVGVKPYKELHKYYQKAAIGVVPSIVNEAFGLAALEMMAAGLAVVVSDAGGLMEIVKADCGIVVGREKLEEGLYDALEALLKDAERRKKLAAKAQERAKEFSEENYVRNFASALKDIMSRGGL